MPHLPRWMLPPVRFAGNVVDALRAVIPGVHRRDRVDKAAEQEVIRLAAQEVLGLSREVLELARERPGHANDRRSAQEREMDLLGFVPRTGSGPDSLNRPDAGSSRPGKAAEQDLVRLSREVLGLSREVLAEVRCRPEKEREMDLLGFVPDLGSDPAGRNRADAWSRPAVVTRRRRQREMERLGFEIAR